MANNSEMSECIVYKPQEAERISISRRESYLYMHKSDIDHDWVMAVARSQKDAE